MRIAILDYGLYIPRFRLTRKEIAAAWGTCAAALDEKSVPDLDEDCLTMAVAAGREVLDRIDDRARVRVLAYASANPPYAERAQSGALREALSIGGNLWTTEHTSSTRSGTEALLTAMAGLGSPLLTGGATSTAIVLAADAPRAAVDQPLDHGLGASAAAFLLGSGPGIAELEAAGSWQGEQLGDRFRPEGEAGLHLLGVPGYAAAGYTRAVRGAVAALLDRLDAKPGDFTHAVFQPIDGRTPMKAAVGLGFTPVQLKSGDLFRSVGDSGAAGPLLGLIATLEVANPGDRILVVSYGGGAAADAIALRVTNRVMQPILQRSLQRRQEISYMQYLKVRGALAGGGL